MFFKIKNIILVPIFAVLLMFLVPITINAANLNNAHFYSYPQAYSYRYGWCYTGNAEKREVVTEIVSQTEYQRREKLKPQPNLEHVGIEYVSDRAYGSRNAYNARELFTKKDTWAAYRGNGDERYINIDNHGLHGSNSVLLKDGERLPCLSHDSSWAEIVYNGDIVFIPYTDRTYKGTTFSYDPTPVSLSLNSYTTSYISDSMNYTSSTEDFIINTSAYDGDSGVNHMEYEIIQYNKNGTEVGRSRQYSIQGPYNAAEYRYAWNETVYTSLNLGKMYGIFRVNIYAFNGASSTPVVVSTPIFYVDRLNPETPNISFKQGAERPENGINEPFNLTITYQDNIDTSGSSGSNFSGIKEMYYYVTQDINAKPSKSEYTLVSNTVTTGKTTHKYNITISEEGNWYVFMKAIDYGNHEINSTSGNKPFVIAKIDPQITIEPDTTVDIGAYSTLKLLVRGLTPEQVENPNTYVEINFPAWWEQDPYQNDGTNYTYDKTFKLTRMIRDKTYVTSVDKEHLYYFNFIPPMGVLEGKQSISIPIDIQIKTPGFGYDDLNTKNSVKSNIILTIKNTKNLSTYITENA